MVRKSLQEVRKIIFDLRPMTLDDLGLVPAIRRLVSEINEEDEIEGEVLVFGEEKRLPRNLEVALYRIVQEALNNVRRHAKASHVWIKTQFNEEKVIINVKDDGIGFDVEKVELDRIAGASKSIQGNEAEAQESGDEDSFGLQNIKDRVENLGGGFKLNSKEGEGTTLSVKIPLLI